MEPKQSNMEGDNLHTALSRCDHALENLADRVTSLCSQIAPVLRPENPAAPDEVRPTKESHGSDIRHYVERITEEVHRLTIRLQDTFDRVDL